MRPGALRQPSASLKRLQPTSRGTIRLQHCCPNEARAGCALPDKRAACALEDRRRVPLLERLQKPLLLGRQHPHLRVRTEALSQYADGAPMDARIQRCLCAPHAQDGAVLTAARWASRCGLEHSFRRVLWRVPVACPLWHTRKAQCAAHLGEQVTAAMLLVACVA